MLNTFIQCCDNEEEKDFLEAALELEAITLDDIS